MGHKGAAVRTEIVIRLLLVIIGTERLAPIHQTPACPPVEIFVWISVNVSSHARSGGGERWHLNQVRFAFKLSSSRMVDLSTRVSSLSCLQSLVSCLWNYENLNSSRTETESRPSNYTDWGWRWRLLEIFRSSAYCEMYALLDKVTLNLNHFADKNNCSKQNDFVRNIIVMIRLLTYLDLAQSPASLTPNSALCSTLQTFWQNFYYFLSEASEDSLLLLPGLLSK